MSRKAEIILNYQNYIESPPVAPQQLYSQACASDEITINTWRESWIRNIKANKARFGSFKEHGIGTLFGTQKHKPVIIAGSGPSLKVNAEQLKSKRDIALVSCLHNFHFMEDKGIEVDYYVTLDAGPVVIDEVSEGGTKSSEEYWALSKNKTLLAYIGTDPRLFDLWQGKVYFFNAPVPDQRFRLDISKIEEFHTYVSNGGNVLGACLYISKGIFGGNPIAFVGADFSFSYDSKFHGWDSKYDQSLGYVVKATDVFGNRVSTWQSYLNFKNWFDWVALQVPGLYINCTEGGCFGAYSTGNLMAVRQMELSEFIRMYHAHEELRAQCEDPSASHNKILF